MPDVVVDTHALADEVSYAPAWIRRWLDDSQDGLRAGTQQPLPSAVLLADISGFTTLADRLTQQGAAGTEELSRLLNEYFGQLLALVAAHGGEPFKFAGDALMALWPTGADDLPTATQRAAACALAIQARLDRYDAGGGVTLSLRVAVAQGPGQGVPLSGGDRWYGLMVGRPLNDVVAALALARPGDAVVSPPAWGAIVARAKATAAGAGHWRLTQVDAPPALPARPARPPASQALRRQLQGFVPSPARARLAAGHGEWLGELRQVTALFALIGGLDHVAPDAPARLQAVMALAAPIVQRCHGDLHEIVVDDKGVVLVLMFGLPPAGQADGAARGARAALELDAALAAAGHRSAIGLTTGRCFCGVVGSSVRREYAVVGDTMNVAARLMEAASHGADGQRVLCDLATAQAAETRLEFDLLPALRLKGKPEPVAVARPLRPRSRLLRTTGQLIGRQAERETIAQALQRTAGRGRAGTLLLLGEAGMGKTRLVEDLFGQARQAGVQVLHGLGDAVEASTPYHAWRRVFSALLGVGPQDDPAQRRAAVLQGLGPELADRAPLLEALIALGLTDTPGTAALAGQQRAEALRRLLLALLDRAAGQRPTCVVLEDGHWFDTASWALALALSRSVPGLLLVITSRPLDPAVLTDVGALASSPLCEQLTLGPLSPAETAELVCQRLGVASLPPEIDAMIRQRSAGLPLFAEELGSALRDTGVLQVAQGQCQMTPGVDLAALALPDTVQGVVSARLDRLPPREALTVKVGSVIGVAFAARLLRDVHPVREDALHLDEVMQHLREVDLTVQEVPEPGLTYAFKHIITREVAYNLMLFAQRRQLHQAVAEWHERQHGDDRPDLLPVLAHHWARAGNTAKAVDCLERSATRTFSMGLGRAAVDQGLEAARLLGVQLPTDPAAIAPLLGAELGRIEQLLAGRSPAELMALPPLQDAEAGLVIGLLLRIMPFAHQSLQGELFALMALRCMSLTLLHGNGPGAPVVYAMHSIIYRALTGDAVTANRFAELSLALDERAGRQLLGPSSFIYTWFNQHWVHPVARALPMSHEAADVAFANGDVLYGCFNLSAHVVQLAVAGRPLAEVMDVSARHLQRNGQRVLNAAFHCLQELQLAKALAGLTDALDSLSDAAYDEARDVASICETDHYNQIAYYFIARARLGVYTRDHGAALAAAERAQALLPAIAGQVGEFELVFFQALALLGQARSLPPAEAAPLRQRAAEALGQLQRWALLCEANFAHKAWLVQAELARTDGDLATASALYPRAAAAAADAGFVQHEALAQELHAQCLRADGQTGPTGWPAALAAARDAYARWGAVAKLADLDQQFG